MNRKNKPYEGVNEVICPNCGSENEQGKFCAKCGANLAREERSSEQDGPECQSAPDFPASSRTPHPSRADNGYGEGTKTVFRQYFKHALAALKRPFRYGSTRNEESMVHGIITVVLFSFFMSLFLYVTVDKAARFYNRSVDALFGEFSGLGFAGASFGNHFLKPFIIFLLYFAVIIASVYGVLRMMDVKTSMKEVAARYGAFLVLPTVIVLLVVLLTLWNVGGVLLAVLSLFLFLTLALSFASVFYSYKDEGGRRFDPVYGTLAVYVVNLFLQFLFADILVSSFFHVFGW
ncbi:MAG: hypothetical protein C6P37_04005 [Caldibacillus debilis]|uniref:Zinc-ribbon domain-containing protein n=1 Tax=Caldibacillus debilis TaxID=301148 RepID=A0A3E0K6R3_9BACI|nr:zinc ribbon domain-containing protein [Caldibacillus debilis]OUM89230.1 MAG: hypothetical protein BAA03_13715 [Caldibacillus debilis]REJ29964.1 MAG: hypothetical protein C6P37_04005 [Caldibacillus debilis]